MLFFLRQIRKKLLNKNQVSSYLLYGIGEIVLVVAGILIAVQIDDWNEEKKNQKKELEILQGLQEEFQQNKDELKRDHQLNKNCLQATETLLRLDGSSLPKHELDSLLGIMQNFATFDPRMGVVNELITSGKLSLLHDKELKKQLTQWSGELEDLKEDIIIRREHFVHNLGPEMGKFIFWRNSDYTQVRDDYSRPMVIKPRDEKQSNYDRMLSSRSFDGTLYAHFLNQTFVYANENGILNFIESTQDMIENNLTRINEKK